MTMDKAIGRLVQLLYLWYPLKYVDNRFCSLIVRKPRNNICCCNKTVVLQEQLHYMETNLYCTLQRLRNKKKNLCKEQFFRGFSMDVKRTGN